METKQPTFTNCSSDKWKWISVYCLCTRTGVSRRIKNFIRTSETHSYYADAKRKRVRNYSTMNKLRCFSSSQNFFFYDRIVTVKWSMIIVRNFRCFRKILIVTAVSISHLPKPMLNHNYEELKIEIASEISQRDWNTKSLWTFCANLKAIEFSSEFPVSASNKTQIEKKTV